MMIAPYSLFHQKEGVRERLRKRREVEERQDQQKNRRQAQSLPQVQLGRMELLQFYVQNNICIKNIQIQIYIFQIQEIRRQARTLPQVQLSRI